MLRTSMEVAAATIRAANSDVRAPFLMERAFAERALSSPSSTPPPMNTPARRQSTSPEAAQSATVVRWGAAGLATGALAATPPPVYAAPVCAVGDSCATPDRTCNLIDAAPIGDRLLLQGLRRTGQGTVVGPKARIPTGCRGSIGLHLSTKVSVDPEISQRHHMALRLFD